MSTPKDPNLGYIYTYIYIYVEPGEMAMMNLVSLQGSNGDRQTKGTDSWAQWGKERAEELREYVETYIICVNRQPGEFVV